MSEQLDRSEPTDVARIVRETIAELTPVAEQRGVRFVAGVELDAVYVDTNTGRLRQVVHGVGDGALGAGRQNRRGRVGRVVLTFDQDANP